MTELLLFLYCASCLLWFFLVVREGSIGIGVRYLLVVHFASQFLVGPLVYWLSGELPPFIDDTAYEKALWLVVIGLLAFTIGGYVVVPWRLQHWSDFIRRHVPSDLWEDAQGQWQGAKIVVAVGFLAFVLSPLAYGIPTLRAVWSQMTLLVQTGSFLLCLNGLQTRTPLRVIFGLVTILGSGMFLSVSTGFFGSTLLTSFYCISLILLWQRTQIVNWVILVGIGILSMIPYNMWMSGRTAIREGINNGASISERIERFWQTTHIPELGELLPSTQSRRIAERMDQSSVLVAAVTHTPEIEPYAYGETLWWPAVTALVPRFFWPDKPVSAGGNEFVSRFTGLVFGKDTSVGLHPLFEFYVNFGPLGVAVGLFFLGVVAGSLDALYALTAPNNFTVQVIVLQISWNLIGSAIMAELTMSVPATILVALGVVSLVRKSLSAGAAPIQAEPRPITRPIA